MKLRAYNVKKLFSSGKAILTAVAACTMMFTATVNAYAAPLDDPDLNGYVDDRMEQSDTPGLSLVLTNGSEVSFMNRGFANKEENIPMTEDCVLGIGSCSKAFTSLAVLLLQEEGKLSTDDSVSDYIPWWSVKWKDKEQDTKIWQLIGHCSGLPDIMMTQPVDGDASLTERSARIAENIDLSYEPCSDFQYSNLGYSVLSYIVETVSGITFEDYVTQEILQPIGMTHSGYDIPAVQGYRWFYGKMLPYNLKRTNNFNGAGGMYSTARDMSLWMNAQLGNIELPEKLENAITASHELPDKYRIQSDMEYAFGWLHDDGYIFHTGTEPAFSSMILLDEERNIGIFAISNSWTYTADYSLRALYGMLKGEKVDREQDTMTDILIIVDTISIAVTIIGAILILVTLIMIFTQKKRLAKKQTAPAKEKIKLCIRCILLIPAALLCMFFPYLLAYAAGYGVVYFAFLAEWFPYSFVISFSVMAAALILMLISSVRRFLLKKSGA